MRSITISDDITWSNQTKEVYRMLRTNIEFTGVENKAIAITSCTPDDGKSTVVYNLARAFAENGKKTLIVDADLRKSVMLKRLHVDGEMKGLTHYLSGKENIREVICSTNIRNLFLVSTGIFPTNPTELLNHERFAAMIPVLKQVFDYILFDTPPLINVIDAAVIAKNCDASMLVVAADTTSRIEVKRVCDQLKNANNNLLGVVLNKVDIKRGSYYGKQFGYGYGYGYYGDGKKKKDA